MVEEDLTGKQFGDLKIIGDTGKRTKDRKRIVLARDREGNIREHIASNILKGRATGYTGSNLHKVNAEKSARLIHSSTIRDGHNISVLKNYKPTIANKTGYKYVNFNTKENKWFVEMKIKGERHVKYFFNFKDAVNYSLKMRKKYILPILNESEKEKYLSIFNEEIKMNDYSKEKQIIIHENIIKSKKNKINRTISSKGYTFDKKNNNWMARININGKTKNLGRYETEQQAKEARQKAVDEQVEILNEQIKILEKQLEEL
ncbi:DUF5320 domain-containing protein [Staphylococcus capitis]|uniref:DUF5320 domain-containing protein n=1 Tax=Staphylococcus capitis TaxID=29388 RepID=UPI00145B4724|nr:DUF5320 domain-containing protein [Staphylococcus capitis]NMK72245.1 DUF5320 domain-containing protein [Staphylococcus capitis]